MIVLQLSVMNYINECMIICLKNVCSYNKWLILQHINWTCLEKQPVLYHLSVNQKSFDFRLILLQQLYYFVSNYYNSVNTILTFQFNLTELNFMLNFIQLFSKCEVFIFSYCIYYSYFN